MRAAGWATLLSLAILIPQPGWCASDLEEPTSSDDYARGNDAPPGDARPVVVTPVAPPPVDASTPLSLAIRALLKQTPGGLAPREAEERVVLAAFYAARSDKPLWIADGQYNKRALSAWNEMSQAADWGLSPTDFALPQPLVTASPENQQAVAEVALSVTALKYARYARGGRIMHPAVDLSSYLDRGPQLLDPTATMTALASAEDSGTYLRSLHPQHPQFERLRQRYLSLQAGVKPNKKGVRTVSAEAKRLLANMEQWRWMPSDMGDFYVWNNIPEYTLRVFHDGQMVHTERIVAGLINKQTPIFSRPMRKIVFRPKWKIPESIKVREIWPSLVRSGGSGLMAQFGLRIETKEGQPVPISSVDWAKADIRNYEVIQPPGPHGILGNIKFNFPNPHTVYMHDTQDKHLFAATQRTYSHGCMRVRNPAKLAEVLLSVDKGWDGTKIAELIQAGPLDNAVAIDRKIPVHITYFTAWIGDDGKLTTFRDVYGHERRITLALDGRWSEIDKGRDHLAPVVPTNVAVNGNKTGSQTGGQTGGRIATSRMAARGQPPAAQPFNFLGAMLSSGF